MKKFALMMVAAFALMMVSCKGGAKSENVTGDLEKDVAKIVEIMNKEGGVNNEDSKIIEEIAGYYQSNGKEEEYKAEYAKQVAAELEKAFNEGVEEGMEEGLNELGVEAEEATEE